MDQSDIEDLLAKIIQEEINREIIREAVIAHFIGEGWTRIVISNNDLENIGSWMQENIRGNWRGFTTQWVFESEQDAIMFKMRWG